MKRTWSLPLAGAVLGAIAGHLWYANVGCANGTCAITSSPWGSAVYGALLGGALLNFLAPARARTKPPVRNDQQHQQNSTRP